MEFSADIILDDEEEIDSMERKSHYIFSLKKAGYEMIYTASLHFLYYIHRSSLKRKRLERYVLTVQHIIGDFEVEI